MRFNGEVSRCAVVTLLLATVCSIGCSGETDEPPEPTPGPTRCQRGELVLEDGSCLPAGQQPNGCSAGEVLDMDGNCAAPGVGVGQCGMGFDAVDQGCEPVLPSTECTAGSMALPGETSCRQVGSDCGAAPWGNIAVDGSTVYVDASYGGGSSDGSANAPWTTLAEAYSNAPRDALIAVAAGTYDEDLLLIGKPVTIWGRCAELVTIAGVAPVVATIDIRVGQAGTVIRDIGVTGPLAGIGMSGSLNVAFESVWIHDTGATALLVEGALGETAASVRSSLLESSISGGMTVNGATADIGDTVIRDVSANSSGLYGHGLVARSGDVSLLPAVVTVHRSIVERATSAGVRVSGSSITLEDSVVRDTQDPPNGSEGSGGIVASPDAAAATPTLVVRRSVLFNNVEVGIAAIGGAAAIDAVVVRDTRPRATDDKFGRGISAQRDDALVPIDLVVRNSLVERNHGVGVAGQVANVDIEGLLVRDTSHQLSDGMGGMGLLIENGQFVDTTATVKSSSFVGNTSQGILVVGAHAVIEGVSASHTAVEPATMESGSGLHIQRAKGAQLGSGEVRYSRFEDNQDVGVFLGAAHVAFEGVLVARTAPNLLDMGRGRGLVVQIDPDLYEPSSATLRSCIVEDSYDGGVMVLGGELVMQDSIVRRTQAHAGDGKMGDGVAVLRVLGVDSVAAIDNSLVADSARSGVATWGGSVSLADSESSCNPIHLSGNDDEGVDFSFSDEGGNVCTCGEDSEACRVSVTSIEPPPAL